MRDKIKNFICPDCNGKLLYGREIVVEVHLDQSGRNTVFESQTVDTEFGYAGSLKCNSCDYEYWLADDELRLFEDEDFQNKLLILADKQYKRLKNKLK